jgi:hypothetical protein
MGSAYIAQATAAGDYLPIVLGIAVMSAFVTVINRAFWPATIMRNASFARLRKNSMDAARSWKSPSSKAFPKPDGGSCSFWTTSSNLA